MQVKSEQKVVDYLPIEEIIKIYPTWFSKSNRKLFKSKWDEIVYKLGDIAYFISSEKFGNEARKYTIRQFSLSEKRFLYTHEGIFRFQRYQTKIEAKNALLYFLKDYISTTRLI